MSTETRGLTELQLLTLQTIDEAATRRDEDIVQQFRLDAAADAALLGRTSLAESLAAEAYRLMHRILYLGRLHERARQRNVGGWVMRHTMSAAQLPQVTTQREFDVGEWIDTLTTTPLFSTEPILYDGSPVSHGWAFNVHKFGSGEDEELSLDIHRSATVSGDDPKLQPAYEIYPWLVGNTDYPYFIQGSTFTAFAVVSAEAYRREHPAVTAFIANLCNLAPDEPVDNTPSEEACKEWDTKVMRQQWDYPERMFELPLGLIMQANRELRSPQAK